MENEESEDGDTSRRRITIKKASPLWQQGMGGSADRGGLSAEMSGL